MTRRRVSDEEALADAKRAGYTPKDPHHPGTQARWPGTCDTCGKFVAPFYGNIRQGHKACRNCGKSAKSSTAGVKRPRRSVTDVEPHFSAAGLTPLDAYPGSVAAKWRSSCNTCGSEVSPRISSVIRTGAGCRYCGVTKARTTKLANQNRR